MPASDLWKRSIRGVAGFLAGLALWVMLTPAYNALLGGVAEAILNLAEVPNVTFLETRDRQILVRRSDLPRGSALPGIPASELTFNFVLIVTLFAINRRPLGTPNVGGFFLAAAFIFGGHLLSLIAWIQDLYSSGYGGLIEPSHPLVSWIWNWSLIFYRVVGQVGLGLAAWWLFMPPEEPLAAQGDRKKRTRR